MARKTEMCPIKDGGGHPFPVPDVPLAVYQCYNGNILIKNGHVKQVLSEEHKLEWEKSRLSPAYFIENYCRIISLDDGIIPFKMFKYQKKMLRVMQQHRFSLNLLARQMGKTTIVAGFILWFALFHKNKQIAVLANKGDQAQEIMDRIRMMFEYLPFFMQAGVLTYNKRTVLFDTGSKIFSAATSSSSIRGRSVDLVYIDEAAIIERDMEFYEATYPVITSGSESRVIMTTTPKGIRGMFYHLWKQAEQKKNSYQILKFDWSHHPKRDAAWAEETRKNIGEMRFRQEFAVEFQGSSNTLISGDVLERLQFVNPQKVDKYLRVYAEPKKDRKYVAIADVAQGVMLDSSVCTIIDITETPYKQVCVYSSNEVSALVFPYTIVSMAQKYNDAPLLIESNNDVGGQVAYICHYEIEYEGTILTSTDNRGLDVKMGGQKPNPGVKTTKRVKAKGCANFKALLENGKLEIVDEKTIEEIGTFVSNGSSYEADEDCHDDHVMPFVLFGWLVKQPFFQDLTEKNVGKEIYEQQRSTIMESILPFGFGPEDRQSTSIYQTSFGGFTVTVGHGQSDFERWMMD